MSEIEFDLSTPLGRHAEAERALAQHRERARHGQAACFGVGPPNCYTQARRDSTYEAYTKKPHPSTLGRGGSQ